MMPLLNCCRAVFPAGVSEGDHAEGPPGVSEGALEQVTNTITSVCGTVGSTGGR